MLYLGVEIVGIEYCLTIEAIFVNASIVVKPSSPNSRPSICSSIGLIKPNSFKSIIRSAYYLFNYSIKVNLILSYFYREISL